MSRFNADFLRYGDVIQHFIEGTVPGEKFMVVRVEEDLVWAVNLYEWAEGGHAVAGYLASQQNFRIVEAKGAR